MQNGIEYKKSGEILNFIVEIADPCYSTTIDLTKVIPNQTPFYELGSNADVQTYNYGNIVKTETPIITCPDLIYEVVM